MRRLLALSVLVALALAVLAAPAQGDEMPTELWAEYPLVQDVERASTPNLGPFLPPSDDSTAPGSETTANWAIWGAAMTACLLALLLVTRLVRPAPPVRLGRGSQPVGRPAGSTLAQYAPPPSLVLVDAPEAPWRSIVKRTGLLRSQYVVLEGETPDDQHTVATSRSFWHIGGADARERVAEDAWDDLLNELRTSGWEPDPTRRSDFYVLLQPVAPEPAASIVPTLGAYGRAADDSDDD
jgi:hypothetical protein